MIQKLPKPVRLRAENALDHLDRADALLPIDREMASFRAITGEEEAVAALFKALQIQNYPMASKLSLHNHTHKVSAIACVFAIRNSLSQGLSQINVVFDFAKNRIDVTFPLSAFDVRQPDGVDLQIQPVEPLHVFRGFEGEGEPPPYAYQNELVSLARGSKFAEVRHMIKEQANGRNKLLYASNTTKPRSRATAEALSARRRTTILILAIAVITMQTSTHQGMLCQAIEALLEIAKRIPGEAAT